jgi:hypothetical protein
LSLAPLFLRADILPPRGYALGWEPVLLIADGLSQLTVMAGGAGLALRAWRGRRENVLSVPARAVLIYGAALALLGTAELVGLWWSWPAPTSLLRGAAGLTAVLGLRRSRARPPS